MDHRFFFCILKSSYLPFNGFINVGFAPLYINIKLPSAWKTKHLLEINVIYVVQYCVIIFIQLNVFEIGTYYVDCEYYNRACWNKYTLWLFPSHYVYVFWYYVNTLTKTYCRIKKITQKICTRNFPLLFKRMMAKMHNHQFICETTAYYNIAGYKIYLELFWYRLVWYVYGLHITIFISDSGNGLEKDSSPKKIKCIYIYIYIRYT